MAPSWIEREQEGLRRNAELVRKIAVGGGSVRPTEPVEMGGDGTVASLGTVVGRLVGVELKPGVEVEIQGKARVVQGAGGQITAVAGGEGAPISVDEAGKVLPKKMAGKIGDALARNRRAKKKKLGV